MLRPAVRRCSLPPLLAASLVIVLIGNGTPAPAAAAGAQVIAHTDGGFEVVPSANGRAAAITEFSNTNGVASSISTYLWRADRPGSQLVARQRAVSTQVGLGVNADGTKVAYLCSSSVVCIWVDGRGVVQRIHLPCSTLAGGARPGRSYVSADLQTIAVACAVAGTRSSTPTQIPLIIQHGHLLPTKRLRGYLPLGVSGGGAVVLGQPYPKPTVVYVGGLLHPLPWPGGNVFSRNARFFIAPHGNTDQTITVYDRLTGRSRNWTPPPGPLEQPGAESFDPNLLIGSHSVSAISDDGSRLVYDDELGTLYLADLQSGVLTTLATDVTRAFPGLSTDGRALFYEQHRHPSELVVRQLPAVRGARRTPPFVKPSALRVSHSSRPGAKLSLTGPLTNLTLCTPYTYTVRITSPKSYRNASVELNAQGASNLHPIRKMHLVAHKTWAGTFQLLYTTIFGMERGANVGVLVVPPHHGYHVLAHRTYHLTPAPGQDPTVPSGCSPTGPDFGSYDTRHFTLLPKRHI